MRADFQGYKRKGEKEKKRERKRERKTERKTERKREKERVRKLSFLTRCNLLTCHDCSRRPLLISDS